MEVRFLINKIICIFTRTCQLFYYSLILVFTVLALSACLPFENNSQNSQRGAQAPEEEDSFIDDDLDQDVPDLYWYLNNKIIEGTAQINRNYQSVAYLRGRHIHRYLKDLTAPHCLVIHYLARGEKRQLRARAIPISFTPMGRTQRERLLRIDLSSNSENNEICSGTAPWLDSNGIADGQLTSNFVSFSPDDFCPECSDIQESRYISLHYENVSPMSQIERYDLDLTGLKLRIDMSNSSTTPTTDCTNSICRAQGFDCCLQGQCVIDGSVRPNIDTNSSHYRQAEEEINLNPLNFINYPDLFFVCPNRIPSNRPPVDRPNPDDVARERLSYKMSQYLCLEEAKSSSPNFLAGHCSDSSYQTKQSCESNGNAWFFHCRVGQCEDPSYQSRQSCIQNGHLWDSFFQEGQDSSNGTSDAYFYLRGNVWRECGCKADPFPSDPEEPNCPDFGLRPLLNSRGDITEIVCKIPDPDQEPPPFQDLNVSISGRTTPHRFYGNDGNVYDDLSEIPNSSIEQEGELFYYTDELSKSGAKETRYNMNAILGSMSTQLNRAMPAKVINIDFNQTYIISTTTGFYTPCPMCDTDSWFASFRPYPQTRDGKGLQSTGFTTARDKYLNNMTHGNYEDAIFGRACWIPPTMIPFSHKANTDLTKQRQDRLKTQSALYINGYQRDWFGFNQGAVIGSFDGVKWFAIGNGRRVIAESNKLFIAINAPFADLADPSIINVSVVEDFGGSGAANFDYDHELPRAHARQNQGGTCRENHQCQVDSDCITRLGWEYSCVDTSRYQTKWPRFDINGNERSNSEASINNLSQILIGGVSDTTTTKRCVYRGRGSVCKRDWRQGDQGNEEIAKAFRCAPNFYCADFLSSSLGFNKELVREPQGVFGILFGQDANVLGRPLHYINAMNSLDDEIKENLMHNLSPMIGNTNNMGICLPGKRLDRDLLVQHSQSDPQGRTDYISQISSCNSSIEGIDRYATCPALDEEGNFLFETQETAFNNDHLSLRSRQNMCGAESKWENASGDIQSSFQDIEANPLIALSNLFFPKHARDACLRRSGSVCHTNLDCGPNRMHREIAEQRGPQYFGSTMAEKKFWEEELICGQDTPIPNINLPGIHTYDMTQNRCCREIGAHFTMHTEVSRIDNSNTKFDIESSDPLIVSDQQENQKLRTFRTPTSTNTLLEGRYSRFANILLYDLYETPPSQLPSIPYAQAPMVHIDNASGLPIAPKVFQWKAFLDAGSENCCGGGWVRTFSDGSNNWSDRQRLQIPPETFTCINRPWNFDNIMPPSINESNYNLDRHRLCLSPGEEGCIQFDMIPGEEFEIIPPSPTEATTSINTTPISHESPFIQEKSLYAPFQPRRFPNVLPPPNVQPTYNFAYYSGCDIPEADECDSHGFSIYLPLYIAPDNVTRVDLHYLDSNGNRSVVTNIGEWFTRNSFDRCAISKNPANFEGYSNPIYDYPDLGGLGPRAGGPGTPEEEWCITRDIGCFNTATQLYTGQNQASCLAAGRQWHTTDFDVMHIRVDPDRFYQEEDQPAYIMAGAVIHYEVMGAGDITSHSENMIPGNPLYYTSKLSRFELLGIPQIAHEPIYCSSDANQLIPNIYNLVGTGDASHDRDAFENYLNSFEYRSGDSGGRNLHQIYDSSAAPDYANPDNLAVFQDEIALPNIFSESEFKCCIELGRTTNESTACCSGHSIQSEDEDEGRVCALPSGTNLNVYFNKFVSSEGMREDLDNSLSINDFIPETGEPKHNTEVMTTLARLGEEFCSSGNVIRGGSTGRFYPKPNEGFFEHQGGDIPEELLRYLALVDSNQDFDEDLNSGYSIYNSGYRWRHHLYCE